MTQSMLLALAARSVVWTLVLLALLGLYRWIRKQDAVAAVLVAGGVVVRGLLGSALFWISYLQLPVLSPLHSGDGFWRLAPDARSYFQMAAAATIGADPIPSSVPSPTFVRVLAGWMWLTGASPASGVLLNVLLFAGSAALVFGVFHKPTASRIPIRLFLLGYGFSPAAVVFSVQSLKDQFVLALTLASVAAIAHWLVRDLDAQRTRRTRAGVLSLAGIVFLLAGIRPYLSVLVVFAGLVAAIATLPFGSSPGTLLKKTAGRVSCLAVLWCLFATGAGPYYWYYDRLLARTVGLEGSEGFLAPFVALERARTGFARSGGDTNVAAEDESVPEEVIGPVLDATVTSRRISLGLAVFFLPIHVVQRMTGLTLHGGQGLLVVTDLDTMFGAALSLIGAFCLLRWRRDGVEGAAFVFTAVLAVTLAVLMAYVVTNFGTLFRLRLLVFALLWLLPALVVLRREAAAQVPSLHEERDVTCGAPGS